MLTLFWWWFLILCSPSLPGSFWQHRMRSSKAHNAFFNSVLWLCRYRNSYLSITPLLTQWDRHTCKQTLSTFSWDTYTQSCIYLKWISSVLICHLFCQTQLALSKRPIIWPLTIHPLTHQHCEGHHTHPTSLSPNYPSRHPRWKVCQGVSQWVCFVCAFLPIGRTFSSSDMSLPTDVVSLQIQPMSDSTWTWPGNQ